VTQPKRLTVEHDIDVAAPADEVFALIRDVERWPQLLTSIIHVDRHVDPGAPEGTDTVRLWGVRGHAGVRAWTAHRRVDAGRMRIEFDNEPPPPGARASTGTWTVVGDASGGCRVYLCHEIDPGDADAATNLRVTTEFGRQTRLQLDELKRTAERGKELDQLILSFEDPLFISGAVEDAWAILYEADRWVERIPHVSRIEMTEDVPNIQFFDMDTMTPDGRAHTTRSVRVCFPHDLIVYKQLQLPPLLSAHTGHWRFVPTPEGIIASARHTVTIKPEALSLLGPDTTVDGARRYARRVLSANSMKNLQIAKAYAEERAHG